MQLDWYGKDDKQGLIRFSGHCRPFLMVCHFCEKLECPCVDATIQFVEGEEDGKPATNAIRFSIKINVQTWEHDIVSDDNRPITSLVTEFMDQAPAHLRDDLLTGYLYTKRLKKAFKGFTLASDEIRGGRLISFMEFMYQDEANPMTDDWYGFTTTHEGEEILVDDCYCLNPQCACKDITLQFTKIHEKEGANALETIFNTTLNLKSNQMSPPQSISGCSRSYANAVLATWQAEMDDVVLVVKLLTFQFIYPFVICPRGFRICI